MPLSLPPVRRIRFFSSPAAFRRWLTANHRSARELWVGFHKRHTGTPSLTWPESVDQALCFGWIDGVRKRLDAERYVIRFTPRRPGSIWSAINIRRVRVLTKLGLMRAAGQRAFAHRRDNRSGIYAYEQRPTTLPEPFARVFRRQRAAWRYFQRQAPWYRKTCTWWVVSAKQETTRQRRLAQLIADSARGRPIGRLTRPGTA